MNAILKNPNASNTTTHKESPYKQLKRVLRDRLLIAVLIHGFLRPDGTKGPYLGGRKLRLETLKRTMRTYQDTYHFNEKSLKKAVKRLERIGIIEESTPSGYSITNNPPEGKAKKIHDILMRILNENLPQN